MKDEHGIYYYPYPQNRRVKMYVRKVGNDICFRLWNTDDPQMWEAHGWVAHEAIEQAIALYDGKGFDPAAAYDIRIAETLLEEESS